MTQLVEWCDRYSPLVAADGEDGIILDITGCTHLFGGEGALLLEVGQRLRRMGVKAQPAIADTWGMAWALARFSKKFLVHGENAVSALASLPVEALRISSEIVFSLRRLGLTTIAMVRNMPRSSLAVRFGPALLRRLDQIFHEAEEPLTPWRPPAPHRASRTLAEPISTTSAVEYVLNDLLQEVCRRLDKDAVGSRHMELACYRVDGTVDRCEVRTSKPTRSRVHLMRLFAERLKALRAVFGFETFVLSVLDVEALLPTQIGFSEAKTAPVNEESSLDALIDRFGMRLGFQEVNRIQICESFLPEYAVKLYPVTGPAAASAEWPAYRIRPVRLFEPPVRIEVSVVIPGGSPVQVFIGGKRHRLVRCEGPERLTPEWWRDKSSYEDVRDYYRVEDEQGLRFWIFLDRSESWFLHGQLP
ncbi:MAG TPA: DNA polymerase Y family protein [Bryobacteraceae bacterium]|nr:DNA polymerase Y family protein [Bryobacteraceae bacterium]